MSKLNTCIKTLVAAVATVASIGAMATPIVGETTLTGIKAVRITFGNIDWNFNGSTDLNPPPNLLTPTFGQFSHDSDLATLNGVSGTGSFATGSMVGTTNGWIHDLSANPVDKNYLPVGASAGFADMLKFTAHDGVNGSHWMFTATSLSAGTFAGTPYNLTEIWSGGSVGVGSVSTFASFSVSGWTCDDVSNDNVCDASEDRTNFVLALSTTFAGKTIANLVNDVNGPNGVNNTWSGSLTATSLPEPASLALVGLALAGLGVASRRRQAK